MKALTIWQPWATAIAVGYKKYETRSWGTEYRGKIAIHAGSKKPYVSDNTFVNMFTCDISIGIETRSKKAVLCDSCTYHELPLGAIVAIADLVDCIEITEEFVSRLSIQEKAFGDFTVGRYAWQLENIKMLKEPIKEKGHQRLWNWGVDMNK